jgi:hypothetical protein
MIVYVALLFGSKSAFELVAGTPLLAYALAILPALPVIGVFWAMARLLVEEQDEYLRSEMVRQSLIATGFALSVATAWGFLEAFDLVPHIDAYFVAILWFAGLGVGSFVNRMMRPALEEEPAQ